MNKFQIIALWVLTAAFNIYTFVKEPLGYMPMVGIGLGALTIIATIVFFRMPKEGAITHGHGMAAPPKSTNELVNSAFPSVEIPAMGKPVIVFKKDSLEYKSNNIFYRDITSVLFNTVNIIVHGIPSSQTYVYAIKAGTGKFTISFASTFYINNDKLKEKYARLIEYSKTFVEPVLVAKIVRDIFTTGAAVRIGGVTFTKEGYSKKKLFGGIDEVKWTDRVYIPQYAEGYVYVYKDKDGKAKSFSPLSMTTPNAVILPELVQACYNQANGIKPQTGAQ